MATMNSLSLLSKACLVVLFPFSALDKVVHWKQALKQAGSGPLPGGPALLSAAVVVETVTPVCILTGYRARPAAAVLASFCVATAVLYHPFWTYDDLMARGQSKGRDEFWEFLKNFGLVGGLLMVVFGRDPPHSPQAGVRRFGERSAMSAPVRPDPVASRRRS